MPGSDPDVSGPAMPGSDPDVALYAVSSVADEPVRGRFLAKVTSEAAAAPLS